MTERQWMRLSMNLLVAWLILVAGFALFVLSVWLSAWLKQ